MEYGPRLLRWPDRNKSNRALLRTGIKAIGPYYHRNKISLRRNKINWRLYIRGLAVSDPKKRARKSPKSPIYIYSANLTLFLNRFFLVFFVNRAYSWKIETSVIPISMGSGYKKGRKIVTFAKNWKSSIWKTPFFDIFLIKKPQKLQFFGNFWGPNGPPIGGFNWNPPNPGGPDFWVLCLRKLIETFFPHLETRIKFQSRGPPQDWLQSGRFSGGQSSGRVTNWPQKPPKNPQKPPKTPQKGVFLMVLGSFGNWIGITHQLTPNWPPIDPHLTPFFQ